MAITSKEWLSVLLTENGASYYLDAAGVVQISLVPKPLSNMFEGWEDITLNYGRSAKYFGLERTYTSSYKFVKDGAKILRSLIYDGVGIESKVYLGLLKWNPSNGVFELYYKAEVDLSKINDDPNTGVTVEVIQDGPAKFIKANENITYEIPMDDAITLNLDGILYTDKLNCFTTGAAAGTRTVGPSLIVPVNILNSEGLSVGIKKGDQSYEEVDTLVLPDLEAHLTNSSNYILSTDSTISARIRGRFQVEWTEELAFAYDLSFYSTPYLPPIAVGRYTVLSRNAIKAPPFIDFIDLDITVPVSKGGKLFLAFAAAAASEFIQMSEASFTIEYDTRYQTTTAPALRPLTLLQRLVDKMTDSKFTAASSLLKDKEHLVATAADNIRGIAGAKIKTTFSDFFDSYGKILGGAIGVNYNTQQVLFERRSYFMDTALELLDLGEVSDFSIQVALDQVANSVKVGYPSQKDEEAVARQEVNATQEYKTPINRVQKELNLVGKYRTDIFGIERLRQEFGNIPNTDSRADNSVFIININRTEDVGGGWSVLREAYSFIEGGTNIDTWYNIEQLTPKRVLLANSDLLQGMLYAMPAESVQFLSGDKNTTLITTLSGTTIVEAGNLRISDLAQSYYRPFLLKFTTRIAENVVSLLQQAGRGYVTGTWQGVRFYGFPQEVSVKPVFDEPQEWTLLASSQLNPSAFKTISNEALIIEDMGIISHKLPVKFLKVGTDYPLQYHFKQMDSDFFANRIGRYSQQQPYFQQWQTNDAFDIQFITEGLSATLAWINCYGTVVETITLTQTPNDAITGDKQLFIGTVDFDDLEPGETYYLLATFGTGIGQRQFVSEPIMVATDLPDTLLFEYSNSVNQTDLIWNVPFSTRMRVEGFIQNFLPGGRVTRYEDQPLDMVTLEGEPTRSYQLLIGGNYGVPDWVIDKINRILMLDTLTIDGVAYTVDKDAQLEAIETQGAPMAFWTVRIREANNRAGIAIDADGMVEAPLTVVYNIQTKGFSSNLSPADQNDTIISVTEIE